MRKLCTILILLPAAVLFYSQPMYAQLIKTFAGNGFGASTGTGGYTGDGGLATLAELNSITGVAFDGAGNIYIADRGNNVIRKVNTYGIISTFAGNDTAGYSGDGGNATKARLNAPYSVATDVAGNVYISDYGNNVIRIVNTAGTISTYAGNGAAGFSGDNGPASAAELHNPEGIAIDTFGNLFIADANNHAVREVLSADTTIVTFAGTGGVFGYSGDGNAAVSATLHSPASVATDIYGNVYIADYVNNAVRKVSTAGIISTFAGVGYASYSGNGGPAAAAGLHFPSGVATSGFGNVYISDQGNNTVRMVDQAGIISTIAGTATNGYRGDGGNANVAEISSPKGLAIDALQRLFIADYDNNVIRVVYTTTPATTVHTIVNPDEFKVYPNPSNGSFTLDIPGTLTNGTVTITDMLGRCIDSRTIEAGGSQKSTLSFDVPAGSYMVVVSAADKTYRQQVSVIK